MRVEVPELVWQNVRVGNEVEVGLAELLLHPHHVIAQSVLPRYLVALWEVIYLLILI